MSNTTKTAPTTITIPVTLNGETREVEFRDGNGSNYYSAGIIAARIGNGEKLHRAYLTAWKYESIDAAKNHGYRAERIYEIDGQVVALSTTTHVRNRQARIVGWADKYAGTQVATAQTYYGSL